MISASFALAIALCVAAANPGTASEPPKSGGGGVVVSQQPAREMMPEPPVTAWAKPLVKGPLRVLFVAPEATLGDVKILAERIEIEADTAPLHSYSKPDAPDATRNTERLREALDRRKFDLIALGNADLSVFPADILERLCSAVQKGDGLVLAYHREHPLPAPLATLLEQGTPDAAAEDAIAHGLGANNAPEWKAQPPEIRATRAGQGRIVELNYPGNRPQTHFLLAPITRPFEAEWEYLDNYTALPLRALSWAGQRDGAPEVAKITSAYPAGPKEEDIPPGLFPEFVQRSKDSLLRLPYMPYLLELAAAAAQEYAVRVQVRTPGRAFPLAIERTDLLSKGATRYDFFLPVGPGNHWIDIFLKQDGKTAAWFSFADSFEGWPAPTNVTFGQGVLQPNGTLNIGFEIRAASDTPRPCTVYARARDSYGRLVAEMRGEAPREGGHVTLPLVFSDLLAPRVTVELFTLDLPLQTFPARPDDLDLQRASYTYAHVPVRLPANETSFALVVDAQGCAEYGERRLLRSLARAGATHVHAPAGEASALFPGEFGLFPIPELTRLTPTAVGEGQQRVPCLSDPVYRDSLVVDIKARTSLYLGAGIGLYSLGRGNALTQGTENLCQSPVSLDGLQAYLSALYPNLAALNESWKTSFGNWIDVRPRSIEGARQANAPGSWTEFRAYMDAVLTGIHTFCRDQLLSIDPTARVGFVPLPGDNPYFGYNWAQLIPQLGLHVVSLEDPVALARVRSYAAPDSAVFGMGSPAPDDVARATWLVWHAAVRGFDGFWWPDAIGGADSPSPAPALTRGDEPTEAFVAAGAAKRELDQGLRLLLRKAQPVKPRVAVYDSRASQLYATLDPSFGDATEAVRTSIRSLEEQGIPYSLISPEQVIAGDLSDYTILVLPGVPVMTESEIEELERFATGRNVMISDRIPGEINTHNTAHPSIPLGKLFGIQRVAPANLPQTSGQRISLSWGQENNSARTEFTPRGTIDASIEPTTAVPGATLDGHPVWFVQQNGEGRAVLANFSFAEPSNAQALARLLRSIAEETGALPAARIAPAPGETFHGTTSVRTLGEATLFLALRDFERGEGSKSEKLTFTAPTEGYWADLRTGQSLGRKKTIARALRAGEVFMAAHLPQDSGLRLLGPRTVLQGKRIDYALDLRPAKEPHTEHIVAITLTRGSTPIPYYTTALTLAHGTANGIIPLARDEAPGLYTLCARDLLTGAYAEWPIQVTASPQ